MLSYRLPSVNFQLPGPFAIFFNSGMAKPTITSDSLYLHPIKIRIFSEDTVLKIGLAL